MHEQRRTHAINRDTTTYNQGIHRWCRRLYAFVYWKDVTQTILTKKTLRFCFYLPIGSDHAQANFAGTAHTKATLMGLLTYFPPSLSFVSHGVQIHGVDFLIQLVKRVRIFTPVHCGCTKFCDTSDFGESYRYQDKMLLVLPQAR